MAKSGCFRNLCVARL